MIPRPLQDITVEDIRRLVDTQAEEGLTLEFKRDLPGADRDATECAGRLCVGSR